MNQIKTENWNGHEIRFMKKLFNEIWPVVLGGFIGYLLGQLIWELFLEKYF